MLTFSRSAVGLSSTRTIDSISMLASWLRKSDDHYYSCSYDHTMSSLRPIMDIVFKCQGSRCPRIAWSRWPCQRIALLTDTTAGNVTLPQNTDLILSVPRDRAWPLSWACQRQRGWAVDYQRTIWSFVTAVRRGSSASRYDMVSISFIYLV